MVVVVVGGSIAVEAVVAVESTAVGGTADIAAVASAGIVRAVVVSTIGPPRRALWFRHGIKREEVMLL